MTRTFSRALAVMILLPLFGLGCKPSIPPEAQLPINLKIWGVFDDEAAYASIIRNYRSLHTNISVEYRKFRPEEYERELLNAFAEDRGPDIFMFHNTSLPAQISKIVPAPATVTLPYFTETGTIKKETVIEMKTTPMMTPSQMRRQFADVVGLDAISSTLVDERTGARADKIYGMPMSVDTMALYYNKNLFNAAGIPEPPTNWDEFKNAVIKLTKIDNQGTILQSGAAIGGTNNVERYFDILSTLMMQGGAAMTDDVGNVTFDREQPGRDTNPAGDAVNFYASFANPQLETYTWTSREQNSLDAFIAGRTAMFFGYSYHLPLIKARAPKLSFDIASMPQIAGNPRINYANYWLMTVSKKSRNSGAAWDFIQFASSADQVKPYLGVMSKPTALKSLINFQKEDSTIGVFVDQVLTARNWYHGRDVAAAEAAMGELITNVLQSKFERLIEALNFTAAKINQTI